MEGKKSPEPTIGVYIELPISLRNKLWNYLEQEGGKLRYFIQGLIQNFFENEEWKNKHLDKERRTQRHYWDEQV